MKRGGGVGIFIMNDLDFVEVKKCDHNDLQALTIIIKAALFDYYLYFYSTEKTKQCEISKSRKLLRYLTNSSLR